MVCITLSSQGRRVVLSGSFQLQSKPGGNADGSKDSLSMTQACPRPPPPRPPLPPPPPLSLLSPFCKRKEQQLGRISFLLCYLSV